MKRDENLLRQILMDFESSEQIFDCVRFAKNLPADEERRNYHIFLLTDAGYLKKECDVYRLSSAGHDFIDAVRDETIWNDTKSVILKVGENTTLDIIKAIAMGFVKSKIKLHTGVEI